MNFPIKSRRLQLSVLTVSLLFVLWLSASMWMNAYVDRSQAYHFKGVNTQEEMLFELADHLATERRMMYGLFNQKFIDTSGVVNLFRQYSKTDEFIATLRTAFHATSYGDHIFGNNAVRMSDTSEAMGAMGQMASIHSSGKHSMHESDNASATAHQSENSMMHSATEHHGGSDHAGKPAQNSVGKLANLRSLSVEMYRQLLIPKRDRTPHFGMDMFHEYMDAIASMDELRQSLHTQSTQSLPEHYVIVKLKDAFWDFRESAAQTMSLLEGVTSASVSSPENALLNHHAKMLMELNARVDFSWETLYKSIIVTGSESMLADANIIAEWYRDNFRRMSFGLMTANRDNPITVEQLQDWLDAAYRLTSLSEDVRIQSSQMTATLINSMVIRTNVNLGRVTILVLLCLCLTMASAMFFRRADRQAHQDELTGLDNRRMFSMTVASCLKLPDSEVGILMVDLDKFKHINDTMGHAAGDTLLKDVSTRIAQAGAGCVSVSRLGGDEFAILFNADNIVSMSQVAANIRQSLIEPFRVGGATLKIGCSIGLAKAPRDADTPDGLVQAADLAMYCAKKSGTNQISVYDSEVDQSMMIAARTVSELQTALVNNEFELFYQPQFNIAESRVLSAEALIRWNHPERGFLTPNHFISIAEENGLMPSIGDWVIEEACRQAAHWYYEKQMPLRVAVNISADHFFQPGFVQMIVDVLEKHKLPPKLLEVEVTESVAMSDINLVVDSLKQLRGLSINVALDDFGTGYSSLSYLQELPLDTLKIDKSFIQNMLQGNARKESITETIISLGNRLNLETVAEGVETIDQLDAVSDMKISVVQGYYYSRPVSAAELEMVVTQLNKVDGNNVVDGKNKAA